MAEEKLVYCHQCNSPAIALQQTSWFDRCLPCWMQLLDWLKQRDHFWEESYKILLECLHKYFQEHPEQALEI
jgi:hypothetical protein